MMLSWAILCVHFVMQKDKKQGAVVVRQFLPHLLNCLKNNNIPPIGNMSCKWEEDGVTILNGGVIRKWSRCRKTYQTDIVTCAT